MVREEERGREREREGERERKGDREGQRERESVFRARLVGSSYRMFSIFPSFWGIPSILFILKDCIVFEGFALLLDPTGCPEISVTECLSTLRNIPEE